MAYEAILWDMDGTLIDSEPVHEQAFDDAVAALGFTFPLGTHNQFLGASSVEVHQKLVELTESDMTLQDWQAVKWQHYLRCSVGIKLMQHSRAILDVLTAKGIPMALVSNSTRAEVDLNLEVTDLADYFQLTISRDDVTQGKPAPECYLAAAEMLGVAANNCLVVEDSVTGAKAGLAAGMTTLFHPETAALVEHCPDGAILLPPSGDLMAWLTEFQKFHES